MGRRTLLSGTGTTSSRTVQKDRAVLSIVFNYAVELEHRESDPAAAVKAPKVEQRDRFS